MPTIRNIWVENLEVADGGEYGVYVHAYKESPVQHLRLVNCNIKGVTTPIKIDHARDVKMENVKINGSPVERPEVLVN